MADGVDLDSVDTGAVAGVSRATRGPQLPGSAAAAGTRALAATLKAEIEGLDPQALPLQQGLARGSHVGEEPFRVLVLSLAEEPDWVRAKIGVCYTGIIAGCSCADDPTPLDEHAEYCEVQVEIERASAEARFTLLPD